jgi:acyl carrier protein
MAPSRDAVAGEIEQFICTGFLIDQQDPMFTRDVDLFDLGFVDSVGFAELVMFVETRYEIELDAEHLFAEDIKSINGFSEIVCSLLGQ